MGFLSKTLDFIKEGIAPSRCVGCGRLGVWICRSCSRQVLFLKQQNCYRCGKLSPQGRTCERCRAHTDIFGVVVAAHFGIGPVRELIHEFKYGGLMELADILGRVLVFAAQQSRLGDVMIVPVPLHPKRLAERGFNQAQLLGERVARIMGWPLSSLLYRNRGTRTQTNLTREQRRINVSGAFMCKGDVAGKSILLVDDVITTGATLEECAKVLKQAGAKRVLALVVARG